MRMRPVALEAQGEVPEDLGKHEVPVRGGLDGLADGVNNPTEQNLAGLPGAFTFQELLQGEGLIPLLHGHVWGGEDIVYGMVEMSTQGEHALSTTLAQLDKIIDKYIRGTKRPLERSVGRRSGFFKETRSRRGTESRVCSRSVCFQGSWCPVVAQVVARGGMLLHSVRIGV